MCKKEQLNTIYIKMLRHTKQKTKSTYIHVTLIGCSHLELGRDSRVAACWSKVVNIAELN